MLGPARTGVLLADTIIDLPTKASSMTPNIDTIIKDHVTLTVRCLDRIYVQGYMPKLQTSGGLCYFLHDHLGHPIPSPALFRPMHDRFVNAIKTYAGDHAVPLIEFASGQDKDALVATYRARTTRRTAWSSLAWRKKKRGRSRPTSVACRRAASRSISRGRRWQSTITTFICTTRSGGRRSSRSGPT